MSGVSQRWTFFDHAQQPVHSLQCESVGGPAAAAALDDDATRTDEAVVGYGLAARPIYDALKRVIGQVGGLLILAQATGRRDLIDLPSLTRADEMFREAVDQLGALAAPGSLAEHRGRLEQAARLTGTSLQALRALHADQGAPDLAFASDTLTRAYQTLQSTSESRFGMMMVDMRRGCCTCGVPGH